MKHILSESSKVVTTVETALSTAQEELDRVLKPVRRSVFERFPTLFMLLVTFGVTATIQGFELLLVRVPYLYERPLFILVLGIGTLVLTGTLYKKLG